jgi:FtsP/CotA-like multicopper oxidase with cupredoxin domain
LAARSVSGVFIEGASMPLVSTRRNFLLGVAAVATPLPALGQAPPPPRAVHARPGKAQLLAPPAPATPILGFEGATPGPLLRYKLGDTLAVKLVNETDAPSSLHWQGLRGENAMDGVVPLTQGPVAPGESFDYRRTLLDPGLFCYRPSVFPRSGELIGRGLKGLTIVDEPTPLEADADVVVALDDWRLDSKGEIAGDFHDAAAAKGAGRLGDLLAVNGARAPASYEHRPLSRIRLRLANLASARIMALSFEETTPYVIAIDSQPCDAFVPVRRTIPVAPFARFELMFDLPAAAGAKVRMILRGPDGADRDLLVLATAGEPRKERAPIRSLPQNPALPPVIHLEQSKKVDLVVAQDGDVWTLDGKPGKGYAGPPLFRVKRGTPVTLGYVNKTNVPLVMHAHGHAMRLLHDLDDGWEPYWRNAVVVPPMKTKHVAFIADSPGKWALHDDILEHEAAGLATWFEVG